LVACISNESNSLELTEINSQSLPSGFVPAGYAVDSNSICLFEARNPQIVCARVTDLSQDSFELGKETRAVGVAML
jgi:hypothetical protein